MSTNGSRLVNNNGGFCECGCSEKTNPWSHSWSRFGVAKGDHRRFIAGHRQRKHPLGYVVDDRGFSSPCWTSVTMVMPNGYAEARGSRRSSRHRVMYERAKGPIPVGLMIDHLCRNKACCNPDHLEAVTPSVNTQRGNGTKLTSSDVREIRRLRSEGSLLFREIADLYGVTESNIRAIVHRRSWRNVA